MRGAEEVGPAVMAALPPPIKGSPRECSDRGVVWQLVWWLVQNGAEGVPARPGHRGIYPVESIDLPKLCTQLG